MFDLLLFADSALQHVAWDQTFSKVEPTARAVAAGEVQQPRHLQHLERSAIGRGLPPGPGDRFRRAEIGGAERPLGGDARHDRVGPWLEAPVGAIAPIPLTTPICWTSVVGELTGGHDHQHAVVLLDQRAVGGYLGVEKLVDPAWLEAINAGVADDLVAAPREVNWIEL